MDGTPGLTARLVQQALTLRYEDLPARARTLAIQCITDWLAVTIGGHRDPLVQHLLADLLEQGGAPQATLCGSALRLPVYQAALLNGTASHALDYDDVNYALSGHPTVPVMPALFALAEQRGLEGDALIAAFVAGYEFECRVGLLVAPGHYARGFHATATVGALGAALACAHLLRLSPLQATYAVGIAATQAAGLKSLFGSDCKPLHAGNAARIGAQAANLAARGFVSRLDSLECSQGFAATHSQDFNLDAALATPSDGLHLYANLFKYHAACFETHATIECCRELRQRHALAPADIRRVAIHVNPYCDQICNIANPQTGLAAKFSLRQTATFALAGRDTADPATFTDDFLQQTALTTLREKIVIELDATVPASHAIVRVECNGGDTFENRFDASRPLRDLTVQGNRLRDKARALLAPTMMNAQLQSLFETLEKFAQPGSFRAVLKIIATAAVLHQSA